MVLAYVLIIGKAERFHSREQIASHLGLEPLEDSRGNRRRLDTNKQGISIFALLAGGSGPGRSAQHSAMAQSVFPPDDATWQKDGQASHGPKTSDSCVLDDAKGNVTATSDTMTRTGSADQIAQQFDSARFRSHHQWQQGSWRTPGVRVHRLV